MTRARGAARLPIHRHLSSIVHWDYNLQQVVHHCILEQQKKGEWDIVWDMHYLVIEHEEERYLGGQ